MILQFNELKATQAAAMFLALRGQRMSYMKLLKLLYIADRTALLRWGVPITTDRFVSMDRGPVPSNVYRLIVEDQTDSVWSRFISAPLGSYEVELLQGTEAPRDLLSRAEEDLIREVFSQYGAMSRWQLVDIGHTLPEWTDPHGSSIPITVRDILRAEGVTEPEILEVEQELCALQRDDEVMGSVA